MAIPSPSPARFIAGISTDFPYGPLANFGQPNPFMYQIWEDDFGYMDSAYTATKTGTGTIASTAFSGGALLYTTQGVGAADLCSLQLPAAAFTNTAGKKLFYACRVRVSDAVNAQIVAGLIQTTATPGTVVDGIWFNKPSGAATGLVLNSTIASVTTSVTIPTSTYTLANNVDIDLAFYVNRSGDVEAFVGQPLFGWLPDSGTGATLPLRGVCARITLPSLTAVILNPTIALIAGTASAKTMTLDFAMAAKER